VFRFFVPAAALVLVLGGGLTARQPASVDTSTIGPRVGSVAPAWSGIDQFGKSHTLQSALGPKGAMLVFFRSADW